LSIRTLLLLLVLAVWVPAVIAFSLLARSTYLREEEDARHDVERMAQSINSLVEREIDTRVSLARTLSASRALAEGNLRSFYLEATQAVQGSGNWVVLVDADKQLFNTLLPFDERKPFPRVPGGPLATDRPQVFLTLRGPLTQKPVLAAYAPALDETPSRFNVVVAFSPDVTLSAVMLEKLPAGLVSVINERHEIVTRSRDAPKWIGRKAGETVQRMARANRGVFAETVTLDGVPSLTYVSTANRHGWQVVLALPQAALTQSARRLTVQALAASGGLLVIGLVLAFVVARRIAAPVVSLSQAAAQLGEDRVPTALLTQIVEIDHVSIALEAAGRRSQEATRTLESKVEKAVEEARHAQAALLESQKLEAIGRLTGGLAHDFNNLLQTISSAHHVLGRHIEERSTQRRFLDAATRASAKAADLVRQMMSFGRTQALKPQAIDLRQHILQSHELTRKAVGERIRLSAAFADELPAVFVDPAQLELALLNLLFNARDAMPQGGAITLTARPALPDETQGLAPQRYVCLEVRDSGTGMSPDTQARAFEPYFTTKPIGAGTGLGLAQVMSFVRQSAGTIFLDSTEGLGTTVRLVLPATEASPAGDAAIAPTSTPSTHRLRICMVEDDSLVSSVVEPVLQEHGHEVTAFESADAAMQVLQTRQDFDVLFTDIVMPGRMTGLELVDWCRAHAPHMAVIVATGYTRQQPQGDLIELRKPYRLDELLASLQSIANANSRSLS
jgi:signal transduction histidine kinase